jgi:hypothetical protein
MLRVYRGDTLLTVLPLPLEDRASAAGHHRAEKKTSAAAHLYSGWPPRLGGRYLND